MARHSPKLPQPSESTNGLSKSTPAKMDRHVDRRGLVQIKPKKLPIFTLKADRWRVWESILALPLKQSPRR
jgi:hypothetical protein